MGIKDYVHKHLLRTLRAGLSLTLALLFLVLTACRSQVEPSRVIAPPVQPNQPSSSPTKLREAEVSVSELIKQLPFLEKEKRAGMLRAWVRVLNHDRFRVARTSDFEEPSQTYDYGEMAGAYGLAVLIVDKKLIIPERFSLVVFIERPAGRCDIYWVYQEMNLARYGMSRASGNVFVEEVREDGTRAVCKIEWDRKQRRWACRRV